MGEPSATEPGADAAPPDAGAGAGDLPRSAGPAHELVAGLAARVPERFEVRRLIGAGAFGAVYEVFDRARQTRLALKRLVRLDPSAIVRFKREFRALADVVHPNLVRLHELFSAGEDWYFTMDLVDGTGFRAWVRPDPGGSAGSTVTTEPLGPRTVSSSDGVQPASRTTLAAPVGRIAEDRLRSAMRQLVAGVRALHDASKLHRDLKPSNVLVTPAGRLVILDFGMVADLEGGTHQSADLAVRGTPIYMSPEQAVGAPVTPASDWYSVGVMLYEALTGLLPYDGPFAEMVVAKQTRPPLDPRRLRDGLPDDLVDLALALLERDPAARPSGDAIAAVVGVPGPLPDVTPPPEVGPSSPGAPTPFVGRAAALELLRASLAEVRSQGRPVVVHIVGPSAVGKSALVRRFGEELRAHGAALVLEGRCYERESVPYKAFDGVMDALVEHLRRLRPEEARRLMPRDADALARLFPAVGQLGAGPAVRARSGGDPLDIRRRGFAAARELLARIADTRPLVIAIDDLQWGDADSAALLDEVLSDADAPALLLCASYRIEDLPTSEVLRAFRQGECREIRLAPLDVAEARALAALLSAEDPEFVARESGGNPLFVQELCRPARGGGQAPGAQGLTQVLLDRVGALPAGARMFCEVVAVAGRPLRQDVAARAAGLEGPAADEALDELKRAHLLRTGSVRERDVVETLHDRIRESVAGALSPGALRDRHERLAAALEAAGDPDPEALALHLRGAGAFDRARVQAERAGDRAAAALAFDRAAAHYRAALEVPGSDPGALWVKLADALASAGRGAEAAEAYVEACAVAAAPVAIELRRRAAEQLLRAGHIDEGLELIRSVLEAVDTPYPESPRQALLSLLWNRARVRLRGLEFQPREESEIPQQELLRIDVTFAIGNGLAPVDLLRGAEFQARNLRLALAAGEPSRVVRALMWELVMGALEGRSKSARARRIRDKATALATKSGHPHDLARVAAAGAVEAWASGEWRRAVSLSVEGAALFRTESAYMSWEVASVEVWFLLPALFYLGDLRALAAQAPACAREARERGDRYALTSIQTYVLPYVHLAADRPAEARREATDAMTSWSARGWHLQHWADLVAQSSVALYQGDGASALGRIERAWPSIDRTMQFRIQNVRIQTHYLRARAALSSALAGRGDRVELAALAERDAVALEREDNAWATAYAAVVRAGVAAARRDPGAAALFASAALAFDARSMPLHAASARRRQGELEGADEGRALVDAADTTLRGLGVASPGRMADLLVPPGPGRSGARITGSGNVP